MLCLMTPQAALVEDAGGRPRRRHAQCPGSGPAHAASQGLHCPLVFSTVAPPWLHPVLGPCNLHPLHFVGLWPPHWDHLGTCVPEQPLSPCRRWTTRLDCPPHGCSGIPPGMALARHVSPRVGAVWKWAGDTYLQLPWMRPWGGVPCVGWALPRGHICSPVEAESVRLIS